jgi:hypothetical protein
VTAIVAPFLLAAIAAAPTSAVGTQGYSFGRSGGNIRPLEVVISATGRVVVNKERRGVVTLAQLRAIRQVVFDRVYAALAHAAGVA